MIRNLALAAVSLLLFLAGAELFCQIVKPDERWFRDENLRGPYLFRVLVYDPVVGWTGRPGARILRFPEHLNSRGLRGPEFPDAKPPGAVRIVALGDSCTFNIQMNDRPGMIPLMEIHEPYPADLNLLLSALAPPGRSYEVINGGIIGYSTLQGLRYMRKEVFRWHPDVILIKFGWNDHWANATGGINPEPRNAALRRLRWDLLQSRFYALLKRSILKAVALAPGQNQNGHAERKEFRAPQSPDPRDFRVPPEEFEFNLRLLVREARARGATPILLNAPMGVVKPTLTNDPDLPRFLEVTGYPDPREILEMHAHYNAIVARVAREERAPFVDLDHAFAIRGRGRFFGTTELIHYNAEGNRLIAREVLKELQHLGIVPSGAALRSGRPGRRAAICGKETSPLVARGSWAQTSETLDDRE